MILLPPPANDAALVAALRPHDGALMVDPPAATRALSGRSLEDCAAMWDREVVEMDGGTVVCRLSPEKARRRDADVLTRWSATLSQADRNVLGSWGGLAIRKMPRDLVALLVRRSPSRELSDDLAAGQGSLVASPSARITAIGNGGLVSKVRLLREPSDPGTTIVSVEKQAGAKPESRWKPGVNGVPNGLDFGSGRTLTVGELLTEARQTFRSAYDTDERAAEARVFVKGRWGERSLIEALGHVVSVPAPTIALKGVVGKESTLFPDAFPDEGEYTAASAGTRYPRIGDWLRAIGAKDGSAVSLRPALSLVIYSAPRPIEVGGNYRVEQPHSIVIE